MQPTAEAGGSSRSALPSSGTFGSQPTVTLRFRLALLWILISAANYGYGISELNALQPMLTCQSRDPSSSIPLSVGCIALSESQFGLVTSLFTLGGLVSSFLISPVSKQLGWGRQTCITCSALAGIVGSSVLGVSSQLWSLGVGRFIQGIGSGIGVVLVPIFLNEVSPVALKGSIGVLNQLSIVIGIFVAQAIGASSLGSDATYWHTVPLVSGALSALQLLGSFTVGLESPGWLEGEGRTKSAGAASDAADEVRALLWSPKELQRWRESRTGPSRHAGRADEERQGLLASEPEGDAELTPATNEASQVGLAGLLSDPEVRPGAVLVILTQLGQQLSGINAVLYYSVGILGSILPALAGSIGILITLINIAMTFPPLLLIDEHRVGRKKLMVGSALVMAVASALLGAGIVYGLRSLSAICMVLMVAGFSFGLGPIPFVILPELVPSKAVSTTTSLGLTLNWTANFIVGSAFLPLKNWLAQFDIAHTGGAVFWFFSAANLTTAFIVARMYTYKPE